MTVTISRYASLRTEADCFAEMLPGVSRAEALQALVAVSTLLDPSPLGNLVYEGDADALHELERVIARTVDDLAVLRRVIDAARAHHGIEQPAMTS